MIILKFCIQEWITLMITFSFCVYLNGLFDNDSSHLFFIIKVVLAAVINSAKTQQEGANY